MNPHTIITVNLLTGSLLIFLKCTISGMKPLASLAISLLITQLVHKSSQVAHNLSLLFPALLTLLLFHDTFINHTALLDGYFAEVCLVICIAALTRLAALSLIRSFQIPHLPTLLLRPHPSSRSTLLILLSALHVFNSSLALILCFKVLFRFLASVPLPALTRNIRLAILGL